MAWYSAVGAIFEPINRVVRTVFGSRAERDAQQHLETLEGLGLDQATLAQFAAEFGARQNRTWWDSLVDGLNRLPRPLLTFAVLALFVLAPADPERFLEIAVAYEAVPDGLWALLAIIIGFYFGGRMQIKSQDFRIKGSAVKAAEDMVKVQRDLARVFEAEDEPLTEKAYRDAMRDTSTPLSNRVIEEWNRRNRAG